MKRHLNIKTPDGLEVHIFEIRDNVFNFIISEALLVDSFAISNWFHAENQTPKTNCPFLPHHFYIKGKKRKKTFQGDVVLFWEEQQVGVNGELGSTDS